MLSSQVFRRYLILFVGVALLACVLAGLLLMQLSSNEMERAAQSELEKRWNTAVEDFSAQKARLEELAVRVSIEPKSNPQLVRRGAVHELELLELLKKLNAASLWNERIILYYPVSDAVFTSFAKYRSYYFSAYLMNAEDPEALMEQIRNAEWGEWIPYNETASLLAFPLGHKTNSETFVCLFEVPHAAVQQQTAFVSALDCVLLPAGQAGPEAGRLVSSGEAFSLWVSDGDAFAAQRQSLISLSAALITLLSLVFVGVAVVMAYLCYVPIRQMTARFLSGKPMSGNELEELSGTLDKALNDHRYSQKLLVEQIHRMDQQKDSFRRQLLQLLLSGQEGLADGEALKEAGIRLAGPFYSLILIESAMPFEKLKKLVEELSDRSIRFYAVGTEEGCVALCSLQERSQLLAAADMITAAGEACGVDLTVRAGQVCTSLVQLPGQLAALKAGGEDAGGEPGAPRWYDDGTLGVILSAIRQGRADSARGQLHALVSSMFDRQMPEALRRCAVVDVFNRLVQCALDARLPVPGELGEQALGACGEDEVLRVFDAAIDKMIQSDTAPQESGAAAFVRYADEHACEISFSITAMADHFGLSTKYIARQIREHTGMPYRNYVIHLRIKEACRLLRSTDTPVCNIHELVGYSSASHFVKVFRTVTGMTPSAYRSDGYLLSPDQLQLDALDDVAE